MSAIRKQEDGRNHMRNIVGLMILLFAVSVNAEETLCPASTTTGEGNWPIPESAFTKQEALKAIEILKDFVSTGSPDSDYINLENPQIMLRGYLLKLFATPSDIVSVKEFCEFMQKEAYVRH